MLENQILQHNKSFVHGLRNHRLYGTWLQMIHRTSNPKCKAYNNYGGRGITVCDRWKDVSNFIEDMYPSYQEGMTIDRINNDGNYEPSNCRWSSKSTQNRNTRILRSDNTSGYRGVTLSKNKKRFICHIRVNKNTKNLGTFDTAVEAAIAYNGYVIANNLEHTINNIKGI